MLPTGVKEVQEVILFTELYPEVLFKMASYLASQKYRIFITPPLEAEQKSAVQLIKDFEGYVTLLPMRITDDADMKLAVDHIVKVLGEGAETLDPFYLYVMGPSKTYRVTVESASTLSNVNVG